MTTRLVIQSHQVQCLYLGVLWQRATWFVAPVLEIHFLIFSSVLHANFGVCTCGVFGKLLFEFKRVSVDCCILQCTLFAQVEDFLDISVYTMDHNGSKRQCICDSVWLQKLRFLSQKHALFAFIIFLFWIICFLLVIFAVFLI